MQTFRRLKLENLKQILLLYIIHFSECFSARCLIVDNHTIPIVIFDYKVDYEVVKALACYLSQFLLPVFCWPSMGLEASMIPWALLKCIKFHSSYMDSSDAEELPTRYI